jgi:hypothetical protein
MESARDGHCAIDSFGRSAINQHGTEDEIAGPAVGNSYAEMWSVDGNLCLEIEPDLYILSGLEGIAFLTVGPVARGLLELEVA